MQSNNLFNKELNTKLSAPLAERLRPKSLEEFIGQSNIISDGSLLRNAILTDKVSNIILSGPPGVGKTTLVEIISTYTRAVMIKLNAVLIGIKDLKNQIVLAQERWKKSKRKTIIFIDEVHRFTSSQQDALLPSIENGTITFIGATTENPSLSVNKALISRSRVFILQPLNETDLKKVLNRVIAFYKGLEKPLEIKIEKDAIDHLINYSSGDARNLINALELAIEIITPDIDNVIKINLNTAKDSIQNKNIIYDKNGQKHYDVISAFIKSIRGSDPDATLYWLANMIEGGEDPKYIFRRLLISACEDIGLADPNAIVVVESCRNAFDRVGFPEGNYFLSHASLYLALSPKSNSNKSIFKAIEIFQANNVSLVPDHLKHNASSYKNPHEFPDLELKQFYLPENLKKLKIWQPGKNGWENINKN